jgi:adenylate cyclase
MPTENVERKLTAILSADVKGYSRLMGEDEVGTLRMLTAYREVTDALIQQHRGRIVGTAGDSILAEFASAVDAVQCAVDIQQALKTRNAALPSERRMEFRIGINVGDVIVEGPQIYGDGVNISARLEALAEGGEICLSGTVYDQVENKLVLGYEYLGEQTVKNIAKPVRVYRVRLAREAVAPPVREKDEVTVPSLALPDKPSIAVLPFVNLSSDPEQEYFSDGMTEDLITDLSKLSGLFVSSRYSVFTYKGKAVKVQEVSRELGVRYVLEGSVRKVGDRILITAQLVDATTGGHVWAERYDRPLQDLFALQEEVRRKIVVHLALRLTDEEQEQLQRAYTPHPEAYDYTMRGWGYLYRFTPDANAQTRQLCEQAIALDPTYGVAYAVLGWTYFMEWVLQWSQDPQALERAFELARKAIALDDSLPPAHELLGWTYLWKNKQHEQAIAEVKRAIAHGPNWFSSYASLGRILNYAGRPEEAIGFGEQARRFSPRTPIYYLPVLSEAAYLLGRYEEAIATYKQILTLMPNDLTVHVGLAATYSELNREVEAEAEVAEVLRINPQFSLEVHRQRVPYKDPAVLERYLAALRKAGLK